MTAILFQYLHSEQESYTLENFTDEISWQNFTLAATGRELRSGVKCIVVTIVTGSLWLVRWYRWGQVNLKTISMIPSH